MLDRGKDGVPDPSHSIERNVVRGIFTSNPAPLPDTDDTLLAASGGWLEGSFWLKSRGSRQILREATLDGIQSVQQTFDDVESQSWNLRLWERGKRQYFCCGLVTPVQ